jgi:DNA-binding response OmpR family regulator
MVARKALQMILKQSPEQIETSTRVAAVDSMKKAAVQHLRRDYDWKPAEGGNVVIWTWDGALGTVVANRVTPDAASYYVGARLAKQALELGDENRDIQAHFLALSLANDATRAGWDEPLPIGDGTAHDLALTSGRDVVADVLKLSLDSENPAAALGALEVLRQIGTKDQLQSTPGKQSPLMAALNYPDPRVQFSAAMTVLTLDPDQPFSGSQRVVEILVRALQTTTANRSVVVDADLQRGDAVAALLDQIGYHAEVAPTGRQGFVAATRAADVNLILLETNTIRWPLSQTIANLRADARTANIPIAIFGNEATQSRIDGLKKRYRLVTFILEPNTLEGMKARIQPFMSSIQTPPISAEEHERQAAAAVEWLARIAGGHRTNIYDLSVAENALASALREAKLAPRAIFALASIGTKSVQATLLEVALAQNRGLEQREPAAFQLGGHIQRHGLLLTDEQVVKLKKAWQSEADPQMKTVLAGVVGSLQPNPKGVGSRLKSSPGPTVVPAK